jgi:hypothetical protein
MHIYRFYLHWNWALADDLVKPLRYFLLLYFRGQGKLTRVSVFEQTVIGHGYFLRNKHA